MQVFKLISVNIILLLISANLKSQTSADSISPTFPKVIFVNKSNEIMLYFDEKRKAYEVPSNGFIEGPIDFEKYIDSLASDFGISMIQ
ncbi:MAG: hypothetical protein IPG48_03675 [Saprospiraceae bacterium]|nr:hypothetical protein [Saprospiraceae bacterium]